MSRESVNRSFALVVVSLVVAAGTAAAFTGAVATTAANQPAVTTENATNVTATAATLNGNLTSLGGANNATVWFEYWERGNRSGTATNTTQQVVNGTGSFSATVAGLPSNTTVVYVAHATANETTVSGDRVNFTTDVATAVNVSTRGVRNVTDTSATLLGDLETLRGAPNATVGFEYWVAGNESTLARSRNRTVESAGAFNATVTGLRNDTTYTVRAYAVAENSTDFGATRNFTTLDPRAPVVDTRPATNVTNTSATLHANLTSLGGADNASVQFEYWVQGNRSGTASFTAPERHNATGPVSATVEGLRSDTAYVYVAHANASDGDVGTGDRVEFRTDTDALVVDTLAATNVTNASATLNGNLTALGGADNATVWFRYWVEDERDEVLKTTATERLDAAGTFSADVSGLEDDTTYGYIAVAVTPDGESTTGDQVTFTTNETEREPAPPARDQRGPGDEDGPGNEFGPGNEMGAGDERGPGDEHGPGDEYGPGDEHGPGEERGPGDEHGEGDERGPGQEHGPGQGHGPEQAGPRAPGRNGNGRRG